MLYMLPAGVSMATWYIKHYHDHRFLAAGGNIYKSDLATSCDDDGASGENATDSEEVEQL